MSTAQALFSCDDYEPHPNPTHFNSMGVCNYSEQSEVSTLARES